MSKELVKYTVLVNGVEHKVDTMKELSKLVGRKVSRADVNGGLVPEVIGAEVEDSKVEENSEGEDSMKEGTAKVKNDNGGYTEIKLNDPLGRHEEVAIENTDNNDITDEDIENGAEDVIEGQDTLVCEYCKAEIGEGETYYNDEQGNVTCERCAKDLGIVDENADSTDNTGDNNQDANNEDNNQEGNNNPDNTPDPNHKPTMEELVAKMREINAKKNAGATPQTNKGKGKGKKVDAQKYIEENNGYPEKGYFKDETELKKFYKQLEDGQLDEWIALEGLTYKESDNDPINRMRKCMAIMDYHFPKQTKGATKKKSKYADFSTEELLAMAIENDVDVPEGKGDPRILRMYTIMALKKAGLLE